jgi:tetratricopeptide (TPR) repeat protein
MSDDREKGADALVPLEPRELITKSAQLVGRGLRDLQRTENRVAEVANLELLEDAHSNLQRLATRVELKEYQEIIFAFSDLVASHQPIIGDCALLPHPKATILYAIKFVVDDYETKRETATDPTLVESYDRMIPTLNYLFTHLARDWHEIAPEDKSAIAKLAAHDSFPDWALPLKHKYIDDERASMEAAEVAFRVLRDKVDSEKLEDISVSANEIERDKKERTDKGVLQYNLGKSYVKAGRVSEAFRAFETALAAQKDSGLYGYAVGLVAALLGDDLAVFEQEEALAAKGLTPLSDDLFQFLNKHSGHIAELAEDEEFNTLMCQLVESKIDQAEAMTGMAAEFDRVASGE